MRRRLAARLRATSVHAKLMVALACTLSVVVGGFGSWLHARDREQRLAELASRAGRFTELLSHAVSTPVWNVDAAPAACSPSAVVLYIEDNPVNVIIVEQMLACWKQVRFVHAPDGSSGFERAKALLRDLVLLDMQLPDMNGEDVLRRLRADDATRDLRVVAVSASAMPDDVERAMAAGAIEYWTKPLDLNEFLAGTSRLLVREPIDTLQ